jgi:hypothetical protein
MKTLLRWLLPGLVLALVLEAAGRLMASHGPATPGYVTALGAVCVLVMFPGWILSYDIAVDPDKSVSWKWRFIILALAAYIVSIPLAWKPAPKDSVILLDDGTSSLDPDFRMVPFILLRSKTVAPEFIVSLSYEAAGADPPVAVDFTAQQTWTASCNLPRDADALRRFDVFADNLNRAFGRNLAPMTLRNARALPASPEQATRALDMTVGFLEAHCRITSSFFKQSETFG